MLRAAGYMPQMQLLGPYPASAAWLGLVGRLHGSDAVGAVC